jgi:hypothetical protein
MSHLDWIYDDNQKMLVAMSAEFPSVEFVHSKITERFIGKGYYHICYEVDDIEYYVEMYSSFGFKKILDKPAKLFNNRRIVFVINGDGKLMEFLQCE